MKWLQEHVPNFSKCIVMWLLLQGTLWTWASYVLAFLGKNDIAETLSKTVVVEILGVVCLYSLKALFENISKNNSWPDKKAATADTGDSTVESATETGADIVRDC